MKLTELKPEWVGTGGYGVTETATGKPVPRRDGVGISFNCPCGCGVECFIPMTPALDGLPYDNGGTNHVWNRTGDTFETLTLTPSILRTPPRGCGWHGFITNGEVTKA